MGNLLSPTHLLIILLIVLILFGRGKISEFMGDFAKGIKSFKKGLEDEDTTQKPQQRINDEEASNKSAKTSNHEDSQQKTTNNHNAH